MSPPRILPVLIAAWLVTGAACSDSVAPNQSPGYGPVVPIAPPFVTLSGFTHSSGAMLDQVVLTSDGQDILLVSDGGPLPRVENAGVDVRGRWNADGTFDVANFVVRSIDGEPVLDGVLIALYAPTIIDTEPGELMGFALRLTDGPVVPLMDPPSELRAHVGERVWVLSPTDGPPTAFGIIQ
jgi:hypothetical protein